MELQGRGGINMKVYIVTGTVEYEFTEVLGVAKTKKIAGTIIKKYKANLLKNTSETDYDSYDIDNYKVMEK